MFIFSFLRIINFYSQLAVETGVYRSQEHELVINLKHACMCQALINLVPLFSFQSFHIQ
jgi:hypothetical protein